VSPASANVAKQPVAASGRKNVTCFAHRSSLRKLWGGQFCLLPPFRRLFLAISAPSCAASAG
jgi:hypothetical protein